MIRRMGNLLSIHDSESPKITMLYFSRKTAMSKEMFSSAADVMMNITFLCAYLLRSLLSGLFGERLAGDTDGLRS